MKFLKKAGKILVIITAAVVIAGAAYGVYINKIDDQKLPIYKVAAPSKRLAITFDVSWNGHNVEDILNILDEYDVKITFFVTGRWAAQYPELAGEIARRGHEIGNHSTTHQSMENLHSQEIYKEINDTETLVQEIAGVRTVLFRPPFGAYSSGLIETAEYMGYKVIQWDIDSYDWKGISAQRVAERVSRSARSGSIVLFHCEAENVNEYLPLVISQLQKEGYQIVPVGQLVYPSNYYIDKSGKQIYNKTVKEEYTLPSMTEPEVPVFIYQ